MSSNTTNDALYAVSQSTRTPFDLNSYPMANMRNIQSEFEQQNYKLSRRVILITPRLAGGETGK